MNKLFTVITLGLLAAACVPHDPDEVAVEPVETPYWQQQPVVVQQPQLQRQPVIVQQETKPVQKTWWQENKQKHVVKVVVPACPCKDPNDPCPQCYQK